jgi:NAD(P)-dependent dehydrogenase (short-subunit alcohol dehydrogenase family)
MSYLEELFSLNGKTAVVTGGNRGIGRVVAEGLAKAGTTVAIISKSDAAETVKYIEKAGGKACSFTANVTDETAIEAVMEAIYMKTGSLDIAFNNAGIFFHDRRLRLRYLYRSDGPSVKRYTGFKHYLKAGALR